MRGGLDGWEEFTSSVERCSEGIVGGGYLVVWNGRVDLSTVGMGILQRGLATSSSGNKCQGLDIVPTSFRYPSSFLLSKSRSFSSAEGEKSQLRVW